MGNVPAKEERSGSTSSQGGRRRGSSITSTLSTLQLGSHSLPSGRMRSQSQVSQSIYKPSSATGEKERLKELHSAGLIVKYDENVDGGYLAPYGTYNLNLDYKINVVKEAIINRKLAPFFTPLQEYHKSWTDDELLKVVDSLRLHCLPEEAEDDDEDLAYDIDSVDESALTKKDLKRHKSKVFNKQLKLKKLDWQDAEEERYKAEKGASRQVPSRALKLLLYRNVEECPICFLYYPSWFNYSRCCNQSICTECFVQIKRTDPHFPHDTEEDIQNGIKNDPNMLTSEPASCPYCATPNFGVTYQPPTLFKTGLNGIAPILFKSTSSTENVIFEEEEMTSFEMQENYFRKPSNVSRRGSLPYSHPQVITTDFIRPDWESKLQGARAKLAKRAAAASAIHASNMLLSDNTDEIERKMIEEAVRLSLIDEESRQAQSSPTIS